MSASLRQYQGTQASAATEADGHGRITLLYDGLLGRLALARRAIAAGDAAARREAVSRALAIVDYLRVSLDPVAGGSLSARLDALYDYSMRRLCEANAQGEDAPLAEVQQLMAGLREAWVAIAPAATAPRLGSLAA
ncbi:MAG TPA: flagellar export chaperone FliS [Nevskiaceae bacterium]|nr:flagellar export chaperone FliS [Nevskiaceae bacterium]